MYSTAVVLFLLYAALTISAIPQPSAVVKPQQPPSPPASPIFFYQYYASLNWTLEQQSYPLNYYADYENKLFRYDYTADTDSTYPTGAPGAYVCITHLFHSSPF